MRTVGLGDLSPAALERRRSLGQDRFDEVWEGVYRVVPGPRPAHGLVQAEIAGVLYPIAAAAGLIGCGQFNVGERDDYRVPDHGYHRVAPTEMYVATAAIVVEVLSPDDRTFEKFAFYAAHSVDELVVADPDERTVRLFQRRADGSGYDAVEVSTLLNVSAADLEAQIRWP